MTFALLIFETALLALLALFVIALLRSHAEILRRLAAIEAQGDGEEGATPAAPKAGEERAHEIAGQTLAGDVVKLGLAAGSPTTLLAFLTSGCAACGPLWRSLRAGAQAPAGARLLIVAKGPERESVSALRELAPAGLELVMCTQAWRDYEVPASPHFVLIDGPTGRIAGRGAAGSWERIAALVEQALDDAAPVAARRARTTSERAARAELALAAAGIGPGDASLYPADAHEGR